MLSSSCSVLKRLMARSGRSTRNVRSTLTAPALLSEGIMPATDDSTHMKSITFHESRRYASSSNTSPKATTCRFATHQRQSRQRTAFPCPRERARLQQACQAQLLLSINGPLHPEWS